MQMAWGEAEVDADWSELRTVAVVSPESFEVTEPVNIAQRNWYGTPHAPRRQLVVSQHLAVVSALADEGAHIVRLPPHPGLPLQFNVRDAAVTIGDCLVFGRMTRAIRADEPKAVEDCLGVSGRYIRAGHLEGGDVIVTPDRVFVGVGERTDNRGVKELASLIGHRTTVEPIRLAAGTLHLDLAMALLSNTLGLIYPPALASSVPKSLAHVEWITVTKAEFDEQGANVLVVRPGVLAADARHERLHAEVGRRGWRCVKVNLDEITKIGGGVRCMTLPLRRAGQHRTDGSTPPNGGVDHG